MTCRLQTPPIGDRMAGFNDLHPRLHPASRPRRRHDERAIEPPAENLAHGARHREGGLARADGDHASDAAHVIEVAAHVQRLTSKRQRPLDGESGVGRV